MTKLEDARRQVALELQHDSDPDIRAAALAILAGRYIAGIDNTVLYDGLSR